MVTQRGGIFFYRPNNQASDFSLGTQPFDSFQFLYIEMTKGKNKNTSLNVAKNPVDVDGVGKKLPQ